MVLAPVTPHLFLVEAFLDLAFQPLDGGQEITQTSGLLLNAILGGILVGFGAMIWVVAERVYRVDAGLGRALILTPLLAWFTTDTLGSVLAGAWFNGVLNAGIFGTFLVPLLWPSPARNS